MTMSARLRGCALGLLAAAAAPSSGSAQTATIVGVWHIASGGATSDLSIQPDGHYAKTDRAAGGAEFYIAGRAILVGNTLRLNIEDYFPDQYCGPLGCVPIQSIGSEVYRVEFEGSDTMILSDASGRYPFSRVQ